MILKSEITMTLFEGLKDVLPLLRANGVRKIKATEGDDSIEMELEVQDLSPKQDVKVPAGTPPEIVNPELMNAQTIQEWSAPSGPNDKSDIPLPLTGEDE